MELELEATKPPLLSLSSSGGNFTVFGNVLVYVMNSTNSTDKQLAFVLGSVSIRIKSFTQYFMDCNSITEMTTQHNNNGKAIQHMHLA